MELATSLPPDLLAAADPSARGAAPLLRPADRGGGPNAAYVPFERVLDLFDTAMPGGETLPLDGNGLPVAPAFLPIQPLPSQALPLPTPPMPAVPVALTPHSAEPASEALPLQPTDGAGLDRFRLSAALREALPPPPLVAAPDASSPVAADDAVQTAPPAAAAGFDLEAVLDPGRHAPTAPPAAARPLADVTAQALPQQSALAAMAAPVEAPGAGGPRSSARPGVTASQPAAVAPPLPSAAGDEQVPVAAVATVAAAPLAETATVPPRSMRREPAATSLPIVTGSTEAPVATDAATSTGWQLPAASNQVPVAGAAATTPTAGPGPAVDTRTPDWHAAFAGKVQWLVDHRVGEARIKLNPPELGAVDVKISLVDDKTYVQLTVGSAAARDELAQSLPRLRDLMTAGGLNLGGASVHGGHAGHAGRGGGYESAGRGAPELAALPGFGEPPPPSEYRRGGASGIDTFA